MNQKRSKTPTTHAHRWKRAEMRKKLSVSVAKLTGMPFSRTYHSLPPESRGLVRFQPGLQRVSLLAIISGVGTCVTR